MKAQIPSRIWWNPKVSNCTFQGARLRWEARRPWVVLPWRHLRRVLSTRCSPNCTFCRLDAPLPSTKVSAILFFFPSIFQTCEKQKSWVKEKKRWKRRSIEKNRRKKEKSSVKEEKRWKRSKEKTKEAKKRQEMTVEESLIWDMYWLHERPDDNILTCFQKNQWLHELLSDNFTPN